MRLLGILLICLFCKGHQAQSCPCELSSGDNFLNCQRGTINNWPSDFYNSCPDLIASLINVEGLQLVGQNIRELPGNSFVDFPNLSQITLSFNLIATIHEGAFNGLYRLTTLYLGDNKITELPEGVFDPLVSLTILDLAGNSVDIYTAKTWTFCNRVNFGYLSVMGLDHFSQDFEANAELSQNYCHQLSSEDPADYCNDNGDELDCSAVGPTVDIQELGCFISTTNFKTVKISFPKDPQFVEDFGNTVESSFFQEFNGDVNRSS